ncbi:hypothetical protein P9112_005898 [Eukaryota sp. TZLM1-RC]
MINCPNIDVEWLVESLVLSWRKMSSSWTVENFTKILNSLTIKSDNIVSFQSIISELLTLSELETVINRFILRNISIFTTFIINTQKELLILQWGTMRAMIEKEQSKREELEQTTEYLQKSIKDICKLFENNAQLASLKRMFAPSQSFKINFKFTNAGATGRFGPSLNDCINYYQVGWPSNGDLFDVIGGIQLWTVPFSGTFRIECAGASGGRSGDNVKTKPGRGVVTVGEFNLNSGKFCQALKILVGQRGCDACDGDVITAQGAGGGGASFVVFQNTPLIISGGGSGQNEENWQTNGTDARFDNLPNGPNGPNGGSGERGSGGGGFSGNGENACEGDSTGGKAFINGGFGGTGDSDYAVTVHGGFGGGGGGRFEGGGGGGFSGGRVVPMNQWNKSFPTYGAGSFNSGMNSGNQGFNEGHRYFLISSL